MKGLFERNKQLEQDADTPVKPCQCEAKDRRIAELEKQKPQQVSSSNDDYKAVM